MLDRDIKSSQLELLKRKKEPDRNFEKGGRSFYFFDLDDNVFYLSTPIYIFHKENQKQIAISSAELARNYNDIGSRGDFKDFYILYDDEVGTFRRFRDLKKPRDVQPFIEDVMHVLNKKEYEWKGPSWSCFYHASFNQRPVSLITARGHHPDTIKEGIGLFVKEGYLPHSPNYLSIYPVSHPPTMETLSEGKKLSVSELKLKAVLESVESAMQTYGFNPHHRFGMSDDDPKNLEMIIEAMLILKNKYKENSFFVIHTGEHGFVKEEVFLDHIEKKSMGAEQLNLFLGNAKS